MSNSSPTLCCCVLLSPCTHMRGEESGTALLGRTQSCDRAGVKERARGLVCGQLLALKSTGQRAPFLYFCKTPISSFQLQFSSYGHDIKSHVKCSVRKRSSRKEIKRKTLNAPIACLLLLPHKRAFYNSLPVPLENPISHAKRKMFKILVITKPLF